MYNILSKFNGVTEKEYKTYKDNFLKRFEITRLPRLVKTKYQHLFTFYMIDLSFYTSRGSPRIRFSLRKIQQLSIFLSVTSSLVTC